NPLLVVKVGARHVVRDGHRRSLASLLAGSENVPIHVVDEPSAVQAAARQLVVNLQREDLTALEKGRWVYRLALLVEQQRRSELNLAEGSSVVEALVKREVADPDESDEPRGVNAAERELAADIRRRVCELTGLSQRHYYNLIYLNRLSPEAREIGIGLSEGQLRPVTSLPRAEQAEIVSFIAQRNLSSKEATSLVQVAKSGDRDAVRRIMAKLTTGTSERQRTSVSWEPLLHAIPKDLWPRCASLRAELGALPDHLREVRLKHLWEQRALADEFRRQLDEIFAVYGFSGPGAPGEAVDSSEMSLPPREAQGPALRDHDVRGLTNDSG
ncbi:MAG TPA: hypothetical protein VKX96_11175, partial [Chloroflexota bacterium]|nr:hypothetical protein [Chloroflexota bacterium]